MKPQRIQLSRKKGFRLHEASNQINGLPVVMVTRPGKWGNPFKVDADHDAACCVRDFRAYVEGRLSSGVGYPLAELRGKNLACFCALDAPCHAAVLLELANR
jgi:hypothetical protein